MNMTVLYNKCTYWLLLVSLVAVWFCSAEMQCFDTELQSSIECPVACETWLIEEEETQWSALYVNNIQHVSAWIININIPEELEREYTGDTEEFTLDVIGYWYDQERMQNMINTQFYAPTSEEMSDLVGTVADFLPLLAIACLFIRAWYLIKKAF